MITTPQQAHRILGCLEARANYNGEGIGSRFSSMPTIEVTEFVVYCSVLSTSLREGKNTELPNNEVRKN